MSNDSLGVNYWSRPRLGFFAGPIVFVVMLLFPPPESLSQEAWGVAAVRLFTTSDANHFIPFCDHLSD